MTTVINEFRNTFLTAQEHCDSLMAVNAIVVMLHTSDNIIATNL